ncbi:hypothetical protein E2562_030833 [Oryza meyeriana var. granulata]|uniref:Uncharacterized protein n=1 Tax=Oryza meyeriana var. granulata TaxID=110450 RepID=A0A6G1EZW7_9ORYZ|nr:hypothetical protein E2562_030833 [Oryza meyeriana var. granulata]
MIIAQFTIEWDKAHRCDGTSATPTKDDDQGFDVFAPSIRPNRLSQAERTITNGTVAPSCVGGAFTARCELQGVTPSLVSATVIAPPIALPGDAPDRLAGELRRGEVHLDVSVLYDRSVGRWSRTASTWLTSKTGCAGGGEEEEAGGARRR